MPTLAELLRRSRLRVDPRLDELSADDIRALAAARRPMDVDATLPGGMNAHASVRRGARPEWAVSYRDPQGRGDVSASETSDARALRARYKDVQMEIAMRDGLALQHPIAQPLLPSKRGLGVRGQYTVRF